MNEVFRKPARASRPLILLIGVLCGVGSIASACATLANTVMVGPQIETLAIASVVLGVLTYPLCSRGVGPKRLVLFLRRFGNEKLNASLLQAFREAIGRRYRVVTLDDSNFEPVGLPTKIALASIV